MSPKNLLTYVAAAGLYLAGIVAPKDRECDCGKGYNRAIRRKRIELMSPGTERGTQEQYCNDSCWASRTQAQDDLEPLLADVRPLPREQIKALLA